MIFLHNDNDSDNNNDSISVPRRQKNGFDGYNDTNNTWWAFDRGQKKVKDKT